MATTTQVAAELAAVAQRLQQSTVHVQSGRVGSGSGVIWQPDGLIVTNAHVATSPRATVELADGRVFEAVRTSFHPEQDLATLKINAADLPTAIISNSDNLRVGELVIAVGNPLGAKGAVTTGIIHTTASSAIIADIRLFPGNSGGCLADCLGRVIGINTMIAHSLAVAIPSNTVERILRGSRRSYLGVSVRPVIVEIGKQRRLGLLVLAVQSASVAEATGIQIGDVLFGVSGKFFQHSDDLTYYLQRNEFLSLHILRAGKQLTCNLAMPDPDLAVETV